jgi:hypothetical protein
MRHAALALSAAVLLLAGSAREPVRPMECAWRKIAAATQAAGGAKLSDAALGGAMRACGLPVDQESARKLGLYAKVRATLAASGGALQSRYGFTPARLAGLMGKLSSQDRAAIVGLAQKPGMPEPLKARLRQALLAANISQTDTAMQKLATEYMLSRVMAEELNR